MPFLSNFIFVAAFSMPQLDTIVPPPLVSTNIKDTDIFEVAEEMPLFPYQENIAGDYEIRKQHADGKMLQWIFSEIKYPNEPCIDGRVFISFVVDENGNMTDLAIQKKRNDGCEDEILRVMQKMAELSEKWTPGKIKGKNVKIRYHLPIRLHFRY